MKILFALLGLLSLSFSYAQIDSTNSVWTLERCIIYAHKNNISLQEAAIQARIAKINLTQSKFLRIPSLNFTTNLGPQFGRSVNPLTNSYINSTLFSQSYALNGGLTLFNWNKINNTIKAETLNEAAAKLLVEKQMKDISLRIAEFYLKIITSKENININELQIQLTKTRLREAQKKMEEGLLPELSVLELETQLATDSSNWISGVILYQQNIFSLKAALNIDAAQPFEAETKGLDKIGLKSLLEFSPEILYATAEKTLPNQRYNAVKLQIARQNSIVAQSDLYPSFNLNYNLASTYSSRAATALTNEKINYFDQLNQNFNQSLGLSVSIPIFSSYQKKSNYFKTKENINLAQLQQEKDQQALKTDIYNAYYSAEAAYKKYLSSQKQVKTAEKVYEFSAQRFDMGLMNTLDLLINQNNLLKAKIQHLNDQYEYIFRIKILEYYKGDLISL